jgi:Cupin domain
MTPLHIHPESDETMYVLEGEILFHMDGDEHRVGTGGLAVAPRGVPHAFMVVSEVARMLCLHTPGCCQAFYWDASEPISSGDDGSGPVDFARVQSSAVKNGGIEILGPPPFARPASG